MLLLRILAYETVLLVLVRANLLVLLLLELVGLGRCPEMVLILLDRFLKSVSLNPGFKRKN